MTWTDDEVRGLQDWAAKRKHVPEAMLYDRLARALEQLVEARATAARVPGLLAEEAASEERVAVLRAQLASARAELADFEDDRKATLAEVCDNPGGADDRKHCPCVVHLRCELQEVRLRLGIEQPSATDTRAEEAP